MTDVSTANPEQAETRGSWRIYLLAAWFAAIVVLHALVSEFVLVRSDSGVHRSQILAGFGTLAAMIALVVTWAAAGQGRRLERATVAIFACGAYGALLGWRLQIVSPALYISIFTLQAVLVGIPLLLAGVFGWRLVTERAENSPPVRFSLLRLIVAVSLASLLFAVSRTEVQQPDVVASFEQRWIAILMWGTALGLISTVAVFAGSGPLRARFRLPTAAAIFVGLYAGARYWQVDPEEGEFFTWSLPLVLIVSTSLLVFRLCGYQLRRMPR